jgi:hypothetical protein
MARQTAGRIIADFFSLMKREPALVASFLDDQDTLAKMSPNADGILYDVADGYRAGHKHRAPTRDELKVGPGFGASGGSAEPMVAEYSSLSPQRGAQLAAEELEDEIIEAGKAKKLIARARNVLEKVEDAADAGDERAARHFLRKAAKLLGKARRCTAAAGDYGPSLAKTIRSIAKRTNIVVQDEVEGEDEEEEDDDDESRKASAKIDRDERELNQRRWADDDGEGDMDAAKAFERLEVAVDAALKGQRTLTGSIGEVMAIVGGTPLAGRVSIAHQRMIKGDPTPDVAARIAAAENNGSLSASDAFAARNLAGRLDAVRAGAFSMAMFKSQLVGASSSVQALFRDVA